MDLQQNKSSSMDELYTFKLHLSFTICFTIFYSLVFLTAYVQLWLVLYLKHKLVSTQTIYFLLCTIFTSQRIVLFSFFYKKTPDSMCHFVFWFLHSLPVIIHYMIVLLITVFYYRTYIKTKGYTSKLNRLNYVIITICVLTVFIFQLFSLWSKEEETKKNKNMNLSFTMLTVKNVGTDLIFIGTISIFVHIYKQFPNFPNAILIQEAKRITKARSLMVGTFCLTVSILKLVYDIIALISIKAPSTFKNFSLPTAIKKEDFVSKETYSGHNDHTIYFVIFGLVLFLWEVVPLIAAMILFRVQFPKGMFENLKPVLKKSCNSNTTSNSVTTNTMSTTKSKFIGVPKYGALTNSADTSSGPLSPGYFESPHIFPYSIQRNDGHLFESENAARHILRSNIHTDSCNIQRDGSMKPKSCKQSGKRLLKLGNKHFWRSSSNKCLTNSNTITKGGVVKANSTYLATANEE